MKDIKTKESYKGIKTHDRRIHLTDKMKEAMVRSKDRAENLSDDVQGTPEGYAGDQVEYEVKELADRSVRGIRDAADRSFDIFNNGIQKASEKSIERNSAKIAERGAKNTVRTVKASSKTAEQSARAARDTTRMTVKTAEASAKASAKAARKTAEATAKAAKAAAEAARRAEEATYKATGAVVKATAAACKAIAAGVYKTVTLIIAGGWVAVVIIIVICLIAGVLAAFFSGLIPGFDPGDENVPADLAAITDVIPEDDAAIESIFNEECW